MRRPLLAALLAAAALLAVLLGWRRLAAPARSDEEQVRALFEEAARAVGEKRVGDALACVSERFRGEGGWDRAELKRAVAGQVLRGDWLRVTVTTARVAVEGDRARAQVALVAARSGRGATLADLLPQEGTGLLLDAGLEREGGEWRVVTGSHRQVPIVEALAGPPAGRD
jgi:hypothetical protein